ncbi:MAG: prepilin-type N-terminal cleavage/methylation domain-containing protein [Bryobacterales bacterium]|nr:prepilin-type N-terminal cleavage/methylation domain-containing protein [Bryobacterales bacterium]
MKRRRRGGFTLLEVLIAATIMAIAIGTLLGSLQTSLANASRLGERDRATLEAKRLLDEILVDQTIRPGAEMGGVVAPVVGLPAGAWRAQVSRFETGPGGPGSRQLERVAVEITWRTGNTPRRAFLEGFRIGKPDTPGAAP